MSQVAPPPRLWVRFGAPSIDALVEPVRSDRYRVEAIVAVRGAAVEGLEVGGELGRVESRTPFPSGSGALVGVTQHVVYTHAVDRRELASISAPESGPTAVLIPIRKSDAWWALAQDERERSLRPRAAGKGHLAIGFEFASRIHRRLYHARYAGGLDWDFLTYFEFPPHRASDFRELLARLRDPAQNPEWAYVERESEVWMTRL